MNPTEHTHKISASMLSSLHKEVNALSNVILSNPLLPILENFLLKIEDNEVILAASDQQTSILSRLPLAEKVTMQPLEIAVPARMFKETLKNLPKQPVDLSVDRERYNIALKTSQGHYKIASENADDFPKVFDFPKEDADVVVASDVLIQAINFTLFAASKDELRPDLSGVLVTLDQEGLSFVATDGHRLVRYTRKEITLNRHLKALVPAKTLQLLKQLLTGQNKKDIRFIFRESQLFITWDHVQMIVSTINETYPDYENVIPKHNPHILTLNTDCLATLKRIGIYANRTTHQIRFKIDTNRIEVIAEDLDFSNEARETIECQYDGPAMEIGFNAKLLVEMLSIFPSGEEIKFSLDTPNRAILITPPDIKDEEDISMLIMPILLEK
ncbi:MAG: DNA polymerase III subunit beta [Bacteroidota bacterium]